MRRTHARNRFRTRYAFGATLVLAGGACAAYWLWPGSVAPRSANADQRHVEPRSHAAAAERSTQAGPVSRSEQRSKTVGEVAPAPRQRPAQLPGQDALTQQQPGPGLRPLSGPPAPTTQPAQPVPPAPTPQPGIAPPLTTRPADIPPAAPAPSSDIVAAEALYDSGQLLEARARINAALSGRLSADDERRARELAARIAHDTVLGPRALTDDPLVERYVVQGGDALVNIGKRANVPAEALQRINNISNPRNIRVGQVLKVPRGPFNVKIYKSKFRLDVYLGDTYIRSFPVGLGTEGGTPDGVWRVKNRLSNPTYYPPASSSHKRIIAPNDPQNPLGEHWIGLEGVAGAAVGRNGYGIHGTIEPDSIGREASLGCVRMRNEDVAQLYELLQPGKSMVTILP